MKGTLLIVDDENLITENLAILLSGEADEVLTAPDGETGLAILKSKVVHCVICDINMPGISGIEVIQRARELGIEVPFIFFTAHGTEALLQKAISYGIHDFVAKPDFDGLNEIVRAGLKEGVARSQGTGAADANKEFDDLKELIKKL